ncbi:MAG: DUF882 domain-containing protein [Alphaproteobacteria bacterium]|nr:MAG: DUF882 domain-containing protein [Alphaproteobacteria bacterium]
MSDSSSTLTRRGFVSAAMAAALTAVPAAPIYARTPGFLRGAGDIRRLHMYSARTGEFIDIIYWIDGEYVTEALREINYFMRDWRENAVIAMNPRNFDTLAAVHRLVDTREPYLLLSGYRTPRTNAMLRRRSRGVAKNSYHIKGMASDIRLKSRSIDQIYRAALACRAGGVGYYRRSQFVHMDCGPVRTWRR